MCLPVIELLLVWQLIKTSYFLFSFFFFNEKYLVSKEVNERIVSKCPFTLVVNIFLYLLYFLFVDEYADFVGFGCMI